jgi:mevalonate kinase
LKATIERMNELKKELNEKLNNDKFKLILEQFRKENGLSEEDKISAVKLRAFVDAKGIELSQKDIFKYLKNFM